MGETCTINLKTTRNYGLQQHFNLQLLLEVHTSRCGRQRCFLATQFFLSLASLHVGDLAAGDFY
jgi:hypothetical protein